MKKMGSLAGGKAAQRRTAYRQVVGGTGTLVLVLFISACAPTLQQQYDEAQKKAIQVCQSEIIDNPRFSNLKRLGLFDNVGANMTVMTNQNLPTHVELVEFKDWTIVRQNCRNAWYQVAAIRGQQFVTNDRSLAAAADRIDAEFLTGNYAWSEYGKVKSEIVDQYNRIDSQLVADSQRDAYAQQQAQAANAAAWAASMNAVSQQLQAQQRRQPTQTNCHVFGNNMNCTQW